MPRDRRLIPEIGAMHVMCRGNNKQRLFNKEGEKSYYRTILYKFKIENKVDILHYCIMNNHVHLLAWLNPKSNISRFIKQVNLVYFNYVRKTYDYSGNLWQGRFKSNLIDCDSYLLQCGKYIELNPVRAGYAQNPQDYNFSSYPFYYLAKFDPLVTCNPLYIKLSPLTKERINKYANFALDQEMFKKQVLANNLFIGDSEFVNTLEQKFKVSNIRAQRGRPSKGDGSIYQAQK
jgi:putative transposase